MIVYTIALRSPAGDGGILDHFDGPFSGQEDALKEAANLEIN